MSTYTNPRVRNAVRHFNKHVLNPAIGSGVDWLRNVLAAGSATIISKGKTYQLVRPQVVDAATVEPQLPAPRRKVFRAFDVDSYVKFALA